MRTLSLRYGPGLLALMLAGISAFAAPAFAAGGAGNCNDPSQCLTLVKENKTITNIKALIILAGRPIGSQLRSTAPTVSDFIEGAVNLDNDNVFATAADGSNDYFYAIL